MKLQLDRYPYTEPFRPGVVRLLFELASSPETDGCVPKDLYLYVWVREHSLVESFQIVLDDSLTLVYRAPNYVTVGRVGRMPMNRAISNEDAASDTHTIRRYVRNFRNAAFTGLLTWIESIAHGRSSREYRLSDDEQQQFLAIT
jgi:hypothetical protein